VNSNEETALLAISPIRRRRGTGKGLPVLDPIRKVCWFLAFFFFVALLVVRPAESASEDERFLTGLRARRLFHLAESYCQERLADDELSDVDRALLAGELIRCYAGQAVNSPPADRDPFWTRAREAAAEFQQVHKDNPRLLLIRVQDALTVLARGELNRQEAEVLLDPAAAFDAAKSAIREAARLLEELDKELIREIPLRHRRTLNAGELTAEELISLQHNVQYQLARAYRNRALCYPKGSDDRIAALTQATDQLRKPLSQTTANDPLVYRIRIDLAQCYRLLGSFDAARQVLDTIERGQPAPSVRLHARAEAARLRLDGARPQEALAILAQGRRLGGKVSAELDFAHLETFIALWKAATANEDQAQADNWRKKTVDIVKMIEHTHGPYWGRRSDLLLVNSAGAARGHGNVEILMRTADNLYRKGQFDDAVSAYDRAAQAARDADNAEQAFALFYKAGLVEHTRKRHEQAAQRLRELGRTMQEHAEAPDAHRLAAWNAGQWAKDDPNGLAEFVDILNEHVRLWPQGETSDMARLWLGRLKEGERDWETAIEAYQAISSEHGHLEEAVRGAARCWAVRLESLKAKGDPHGELAHAAAGYFERQIADLRDEPSAESSELDRFCAEQAARIYLQFTTDGYAKAESVLGAAIAGLPAPDPAWTAVAQSLLVIALAGQPGSRKEAEQVLMKTGSSSPERLLELLDGLAAIAETADPQVKQELAKLQLAVADRLWGERSQVAPAKQQMLRRVRAESLKLAGRRKEAVAAYAELAKENPDSGNIQETYAELLLEGDDAESLRDALDQWRRVASRTRPRTERWFKAKYSVALALWKLGENQQAAERIRYLQAIPPGLEGTPWKDRFLELLRQCETR